MKSIKKMKGRTIGLFSAFLLTLGAAFTALAACSKDGEGGIKEVYSNLDHAQMYELAEFGLDIDVSEDVNVYDSRDINVTARIEDAAGNSYSVPMFYYEEYSRRLNGNREVLTKVGDGQFRMRYTPRTAGTHSYYVTVIRDGEMTRYPEKGVKTFEVKPGTKDAFLTVSEDNRHLEFDNGSPFVGIGNNFCGWEWAGDDHLDGTYGDDRWFQQIAASGGNMIQFDLCEADQLEWTKVEGELEWSDCYDGLGYYNQKIGFKTDYKVNLADELGLFYRFSLYHWGDFDIGTETFSEWGWARNPYNVANGGPAQDVADFFVNEEAKRATKNYLRYAVARWGYSPTLMIWELWNEVDAQLMVWGGNDDYYTSLSGVTSWHSEMAKYVKSLDIYSHPVSTSCGNSADDSGSALWAIDDMDMTTIHRYTIHNNWFGETQYESVKAVKRIINARFDAANKPTFLGEYGLSPSGDIQRENDREGVAFHNGLYSSIFSNAIGTTMHWTWGSYVDEYNMYEHYRAVSTLFKGADLRFAMPFDNLSRAAGDGVMWYMGLRTQANNRAYLWIKDSKYDYNWILDGYKTPLEIATGTISVEGMLAGEYAIEFLDTYENEVISTIYATAGADGVLTVEYPAFQRDIAAKIVKLEDYYQSEDMVSGGDDFVPTASYTKQNETSVTLYANGYDIGGSADAGRFAYLTVTGDFTYTVRLDRTNYSASGAKGGVMVRESLNSASKMAFIGCQNNGDFFALHRKKIGLSATFENYGHAELGTYLRVVRKDNTMTTYLSEDGIHFVKVSEMIYDELKETLMVGVMASNRNATGYNKAIFNDIILVRG